MAVPRPLRSYLLTAIALIFFPILYLEGFSGRYTQEPGHDLTRGGSIDAIGLAYSYSPLPRQDFTTLAKYPAHNIQEPSKNAFATFYCTRQSDTRGPYFESTQSIIWRLLWSPYRSKYPIIVFVCPFIPEEQRRIFRGQGALVKQISLLDDIIPDSEISSKRWIDVLSKLNLWAETEWARLVFLDGDAFPVTNIDELFDIVPMQRCKEELLKEEDRAVVENGVGGESMCDYVYAGVEHVQEMINAGVLVISPNKDMHAKLLRAARSTGDYTPQDMEQGVLKSINAFASDGPFPVYRLPPVWNTLPEYYVEHRDEGRDGDGGDGPVKILHVKWWNRLWGGYMNLSDLNDQWDKDWMSMCRFYDDPINGFVDARKTGVYKSPWELYRERLAEQAKEKAEIEAEEVGKAEEGHEDQEGNEDQEDKEGREDKEAQETRGGQKGPEGLTCIGKECLIIPTSVS